MLVQGPLRPAVGAAVGAAVQPGMWARPDSQALAITVLVQHLRAPSSAAQRQQAAQALRQHAFDVATHATILHAGGVAALVQLLDPGAGPALQQDAAGALRNLAMGDDGRKALAQGGAVLPLVRLLQPDTIAGVQE